MSFASHEIFVRIVLQLFFCTCNSEPEKKSANFKKKLNWRFMQKYSKPLWKMKPCKNMTGTNNASFFCASNLFSVFRSMVHFESHNLEMCFGPALAIWKQVYPPSFFFKAYITELTRVLNCHANFMILFPKYIGNMKSSLLSISFANHT